MVLGLKTFRFDKTIVFELAFFSPIIPVALPQQCLYFLPEPQPQELRPIFRSACDMMFSLRKFSAILGAVGAIH